MHFNHFISLCIEEISAWDMYLTVLTPCQIERIGFNKHESMSAVGGEPASIYPDILSFLETSGLEKTARKFRKETGCSVTADTPLPLVSIVAQARRRTNKKAAKREAAAAASNDDVVASKTKNEKTKADRQLKKEVENVIAQLGGDMINELSSIKSKNARTRDESQSAYSTDTPNSNSGNEPVAKKARYLEQNQMCKSGKYQQPENNERK